MKGSLLTKEVLHDKKEDADHCGRSGGKQSNKYRVGIVKGDIFKSRKREEDSYDNQIDTHKPKSLAGIDLPLSCILSDAFRLSLQTINQVRSERIGTSFFLYGLDIWAHEQYPSASWNTIHRAYQAHWIKCPACYLTSPMIFLLQAYRLNFSMCRL